MDGYGRELDKYIFACAPLNEILETPLVTVCINGMADVERRSTIRVLRIRYFKKKKNSKKKNESPSIVSFLSVHFPTLD